MDGGIGLFSAQEWLDDRILLFLVRNEVFCLLDSLPIGKPILGKVTLELIDVRL